MADTDFTNKTVYEEQRLRLKESYDELDRAREHFEHQRTNSLAYFNKQKQDELDQRMLERAQQLGDKGFTQDQIREHQKSTSDWLQQRQKAVDNYRSGDFKSEIKAGNLATFDKKAAELVEKGNTLTSVAFLQQAAELSRQQYNIHTERQEALADQIEKARESGDERAAKMLEARKEYEDAAYERDTAASVLNKHASLYGVDSKQYREQQAAYEELSQAADQLHERLAATMEADSETASTYDDLVDKMVDDIDQQEVDKAAQAEAKAAADTDAQKQAELDVQAQAEAEQQKLEAQVAELAAADDDRDQEILDEREAEAEAQKAAHQESWENDQPEFDDDDQYVRENRAEQAHEEDLRLQHEGTYEEDPDNDAESAVDRHLNGDEDNDDYDDDPATDHLDEDDTERQYDGETQAPARELSPVDEQRGQLRYDVTGTFLREQLEDGTRDDFSQEYREQMDQSWDRLNEAYDSGDHAAILDAQDDLQKRIETFNGYMDDREEMKDKLGEMQSSGDAYLESDNDSQRESAREDYKQAYKDADAYADKLKAEDKPWADDMRQQVQSTATEIEKKEDDRQQETTKSADTDEYRQPSDKEVADNTEGQKADQADSQNADNSGEREDSQGNSLKSARQEADTEKADEKSSQISSKDVDRAQKEIERQRQADAQKERETQH